MRQQHVQRAWGVLQLFHKMRELWSQTEEDGVKPWALPPPPKEFQSKVPDHAQLPPDMASFPATQPNSSKPVFPADASPVQIKECRQGPALERAMAKGFGPNDESVQIPVSFLSDREIARRTVLRGKSHVSFGDLSLRKVETTADGSRRKATVTKECWGQVMSAAFEKYPIGKFDRGAVHFSQPPDEPSERAIFHNYLVDCCQVSLRQFAEALSKEAKKAALPKEAKKRKQEEGQQAED